MQNTTSKRFKIIKECIEQQLDIQEDQCAEDLLALKNHQENLMKRYNDLLDVSSKLKTCNQASNLITII